MPLEHRRRFIGLSLAAAAGGLVGSAAAEQLSRKDTAPSAAASPPVPTFLVVYRHGPRWVSGVQMSEQKGMREHFRHYLELYRAGRLKDAGGFADESAERRYSKPRTMQARPPLSQPIRRWLAGCSYTN